MPLAALFLSDCNWFATATFSGPCQTKLCLVLKGGLSVDAALSPSRAAELAVVMIWPVHVAGRLTSAGTQGWRLPDLVGVLLPYPLFHAH